MKKSILILAGATLLFGGCAKVENENNEVVPEKETHKVILKASIADNTRVSADAAGTYSWQENDQITVFLEGTDGLHPAPFRALSSGSTTEFEGTILNTDNLGQYAFYPARLLAPEHSVSPLSFALASEYEYRENATNMPMLGEIESNSISFKAVGGLLKLIVYNVPEDAVKLRFSVGATEGITGVFPISGEQISSVTADNDHSNSIVFDFTENRKQNMVFYIPLPVGTYTSLTFDFLNSSNGSLFSKTASLSSGLSVGRNQIIVAPALNAAPTTTKTLWSEDFTGYAANAVPSGSVAKGYNGAFVNYTCTGTGTKIYNESSAGGTEPELLINKSSGSFTVSGMPTESATSATLTFNENYNRTVVTSTTSGITIKSVSFSSQVYSCTISIAAGVDNFDLVFTNTNTGSNVRVDNFVVEAVETGLPVTAPTINTNDISATIAANKLSASIDGVRLANPLDDQGIVASTDADWLSLRFEGDQSFEVGKKLVAEAVDHNYDVEERIATVTLSATGVTKTVTIKQTSSLVPNPTLTAIEGDASFTITWTGNDKAASYVGYYSTSELSDPTAGTQLSISANGNAYTATPSGVVVNGTKYYVYVKVGSLIESATAYQIATGWATSEVTPSQAIDYSTTYTSNISLSNPSGTEVSAVKVKINNQEYPAIKAGTGKKAGKITGLTIPEGSTHLHLHAAGWNGEDVTIRISTVTNNATIATLNHLTADSGISGSVTTYPLNGTLSDYYFDIALTGTSAKTIAIESTSDDHRFVIWGVNAE